MSYFRFVVASFVAAMLGTPLLFAQSDSKRISEQIDASYAAHKSDFDYLLGDWEFTAESHDYGKFHGRWSAVRLDTGQILDEYRVLGDKGETFYVTSTIRSYNAITDRWELISMERGGGLARLRHRPAGGFGDAHRTEIRRCPRQAGNAADQVLQHSAGSILVERGSFDGRRPDMGEGLSDD